MLLTPHSTVFGQDYIPRSFTVVIPTGGPAEACANVTIIDDTSLEGSHNFSVGIVSTSLNTSVLAVNSEPVVIEIQDNECKTQNCQCKSSTFSGHFLLTDASVSLLESDPIPEGASGEICVTLLSQSFLTLGFDVVVGLNISDGTAGTDVKQGKTVTNQLHIFFHS